LIQIRNLKGVWERTKSIDEIYKEIFDDGRLGLMYAQIMRNPLIRLYDLLAEYRREIKKPEDERDSRIEGESN
jgi:hypothetical protein